MLLAKSTRHTKVASTSYEGQGALNTIYYLEFIPKPMHIHFDELECHQPKKGESQPSSFGGPETAQVVENMIQREPSPILGFGAHR